MELIKTVEKGSRKAEIYKSNGKFEVYCMIGNNLSRSFPVKSYVKQKRAENYASDFLVS